jgi:hypothetical protein
MKSDVRRRSMSAALPAVAALLVIAGVAAAQATRTPVSGTETILEIRNQGEVKCQGATPTGDAYMPCPEGVNGTVRGRQSVADEATADARLNGTNYITANANIHADGTMNIWGTFRLEVTLGGVWEGRWEGKQSINGSTSYSATGHGSGGSVEGLQVLWDGNYAPNSVTATIEARILAPVKSGRYTSNGFGSKPADYTRVGLKPDSFKLWEDGFRTADTNSDPNVYEWWYADFTGVDGTVVSFTLKTRPGDGLLPNVTEQGRKPAVAVIITDPDGTPHRVVKTYEWDEFSSATDRCEVHVGPFTFEGDLKTYHMGGTEFETDDSDEPLTVDVDLTLTNLVSPYRPGTGFIFLGDTDNYQAWFNAVPAGKAEGTITVAGETREFSGEGYHDHQWGNIAFPYFIEHWRWGRIQVGKYSVVGVKTHLRPEWGSAYQPVLLIDDTETGKRIVASYSIKDIKATESDAQPYPNPDYPKDKDYYAKVDWTYTSGNDYAHVTMTDTDKLIVSRNLTVNLSPDQEATLANLGIDEIWYTRYDADATLDLNVSGTQTSGTGKGTLENAQFGLGNSF